MWILRIFLEQLFYIKHLQYISQVLFWNRNHTCFTYTTSFMSATLVNPFHATAFFWNPLKTENFCFFYVYRDYQKISVAWNGLEKGSVTYLFLQNIWNFHSSFFAEHLLVSASITLNKQKAVQNRTSKLKTAQKQSAGFVSVKVLF